VLFGKTAITFAYDLRLRRILYENRSTENFEGRENASGDVAEFRFAKNGPKNDVLDVLSLDVGIG
jgi:hypothetical protein